MGCSFTSAVPSDLWDTSMTEWDYEGEQVVVSGGQTDRFEAFSHLLKHFCELC